MADDKFKNIFDISWYEKSIQSKLKNPLHFGGALESFIEANNKTKKAFGGLDVSNFVTKNPIPKTALDYLTTSKYSTHSIHDAIVEQTKKIDLVQGMIGGGSTVNILAAYKENVSKNSAIDTLIFGMKDTVLQHRNSYQSFLDASQSISKSLYSSSALATLYQNGTNLFTAQNFIENKKLNPFDVVSGTTFSNLIKNFDNIDEEFFDKEFKNIPTDLLNSPELKTETMALAAIINANIDERNYKKIEEYLTDWIDKMSIRFNISKQTSYFIAMVIIFLSGFTAKEMLSHKKSETITYVVNNTYVQANKTITYLIIKPAPVYQKDHDTSRKVGKIKENVAVEIIRMKEGWCLVKGLVTIVVKGGKIKTEKDTLIQGWIHQRYLSNFQ